MVGANSLESIVLLYVFTAFFPCEVSKYMFAVETKLPDPGVPFHNSRTVDVYCMHPAAFLVLQGLVPSTFGGDRACGWNPCRAGEARREGCDPGLCPHRWLWAWGRRVRWHRRRWRYVGGRARPQPESNATGRAAAWGPSVLLCVCT